MGATPCASPVSPCRPLPEFSDPKAQTHVGPVGGTGPTYVLELASPTYCSVATSASWPTKSETPSPRIQASRAGPAMSSRTCLGGDFMK